MDFTEHMNTIYNEVYTSVGNMVNLLAIAEEVKLIEEQQIDWEKDIENEVISSTPLDQLRFNAGRALRFLMELSDMGKQVVLVPRSEEHFIQVLRDIGMEIPEVPEDD